MLDRYDPRDDVDIPAVSVVMGAVLAGLAVLSILLEKR